MFPLSNELVEGVYESNLGKTADEIIRLQERFSIWGHGAGYDKHGEEKAIQILTEGHRTTEESLGFFAYQMYEYPDKNYRKSSIVHQIKGGFNGRNVWVFFATPKGITFSESENRQKARDDTKRVMFKYDDIPAGELWKLGGKHYVDLSRIVGYMDAYGQYHINPKFDSEKLSEEYKADGY